MLVFGGVLHNESLRVFGQNIATENIPHESCESYTIVASKAIFSQK